MTQADSTYNTTEEFVGAIERALVVDLPGWAEPLVWIGFVVALGLAWSFIKWLGEDKSN